MDDAISAGDVVGFHFSVQDEEGTLYDNSWERGRPMWILHGARNALPGLERALDGRSVGDRFRVWLPPELAYGHAQGEALPVPRDILPDDAVVEEGGRVVTQTASGRPMMLWVVKVERDQVWVQPHHPLAGKRLLYDVAVLSIRTATPSEMAQGFPDVPDVDAPADDPPLDA